MEGFLCPQTVYLQNESEQSFYLGSLCMETTDDQRAGVGGKLKEDLLKTLRFILSHLREKREWVTPLRNWALVLCHSFILPVFSRRHLSSRLALPAGTVSTWLLHKSKPAASWAQWSQGTSGILPCLVYSTSLNTSFPSILPSVCLW